MLVWRGAEDLMYFPLVFGVAFVYIWSLHVDGNGLGHGRIPEG